MKEPTSVEPIEFATSLELDIVYARWHGGVDFEQILQNFARYIGDAYYRPGRPELIDLAAVTESDLNFNLARSLLRQVNEQAPGTVVETHTVLYSPNETMFGLGRMYQTLADIAGGIRVEVHSTEGEALSALGLPYTTIAELRAKGVFHPATPKAGA